jgi:hypothetical protein
MIGFSISISVMKNLIFSNTPVAAVFVGWRWPYDRTVAAVEKFAAAFGMLLPT